MGHQQSRYMTEKKPLSFHTFTSIFPLLFEQGGLPFLFSVENCVDKFRRGPVALKQDDRLIFCLLYTSERERECCH